MAGTLCKFGSNIFTNHHKAIYEPICQNNIFPVTYNPDNLQFVQ